MRWRALINAGVPGHGPASQRCSASVAHSDKALRWKSWSGGARHASGGARDVGVTHLELPADHLRVEQLPRAVHDCPAENDIGVNAIWCIHALIIQSL